MKDEEIRALASLLVAGSTTTKVVDHGEVTVNADKTVAFVEAVISVPLGGVATALATTHTIERTSWKGDGFIGTCVLCGAKSLTSKQANDFCSNPGQVTKSEAITMAIVGPK